MVRDEPISEMNTEANNVAILIFNLINKRRTPDVIVEEVEKAVRAMNIGKPAGNDGTVIELLKYE